MNKQESDILNVLLSEPYAGQRILSEDSGHSLGVVNRCVRSLKQAGYLDEQTRPTEKASREFREKVPRRAVILADGFGLRMGSGGEEIPKGLLRVRGEVLVERTIRQLHEAGIREIYAVVGYRKEQYEYLIDAWNVELVANPDYASGGTLSSLARVLPHLSDVYIVPCDVWCRQNPYRRHEPYSWYMIGDWPDSTSPVRANRKMELVPTEGQEGGSGLVGIAYLLEEQAAIVRGRILEWCGKGRHAGGGGLGTPESDRISDGSERSKGQKGTEELEGDKWFGGYGWLREKGWPWERVLYEKNRILIPARVIRRADAVCIHSLEHLLGLEAVSDRPREEALAVGRAFLGAAPESFTELSPEKATIGRTFLFSGRGIKYILRTPGEGIKHLITPKQEMQVYAVISGKGICDEPVYASPEYGCRIMEYPAGARACDPTASADLEKCMVFLRRFHEMGLKVDHEFDVFGNIERYESLWEGGHSLYKDYEKTKKDILSLKPYIDSHVTQKSLTHMNPAPDNFLIFDGKGGKKFPGMPRDRDGTGEVRLVSWEYAGMQDPHVDIALFGIASLYQRQQVDDLITLYFGGACPDGMRIKIYCYIAACGLLRSNWCEYRMRQGTEFGDYSLRQYRYAKEYYRIVQEELP